MKGKFQCVLRAYKNFLLREKPTRAYSNYILPFTTWVKIKMCYCITHLSSLGFNTNISHFTEKILCIPNGIRD